MFLAFVLFLLTSTPDRGLGPPETAGTDTNGVNYQCQGTNRVEMMITNAGIFASTESSGDGCWWPKGTGQTYIEQAGLWFGTVEPQSGDTLVSAGTKYDYFGGLEFRPGLSGHDPKSNINQIYMYPDRWPPNHDSFPMAPYRALSHQDSWCVYNDCDPEYHNTRPIGIEIYQTDLAWTYPLIQDMICFIYEIRNVSGRILRDNYLGFNVELCIGNGSGTGNDIISAIPGRWYQFSGGDSVLADDLGYGWQTADEVGWNPPVPGVIGFDLLQTPYDLVAGHDKDADGIPDQYERDSVFYSQSVPPGKWDVDSDLIPDWRDASQNPQVGMSAFKRFTLGYEPSRDQERYLSMAGYNFRTHVYQPFDTIPPSPDEQRFCISCGPFDLMPDSSAIVALGITFANWYWIYETPDTALVQADRWLQDAWDGLYFETGVSRIPPTIYDSIAIVVSPNPSNNRIAAAITMTEERDITLGLYDVCGRKVLDLYDGTMPRGINGLSFAVREYPQGTYFMVLKAGDRQYSRRLVVVK